jgi:hypothetical protein
VGVVASFVSAGDGWKNNPTETAAHKLGAELEVAWAKAGGGKQCLVK